MMRYFDLTIIAAVLMGCTDNPIDSNSFDGAVIGSADESIRRKCQEGRSEEIVIRAADDPLRLRVKTCRGAGAQGVVIFVEGGPGDRPLEGLGALDTKFLSAGYDVISPFYTSLEDRPWRSDADNENANVIGEAVIDVRATLAWTRQRYDRVILAGSSAGGYIAAATCMQECPDALLLLAPLIESPVENFRKFASDFEVAGEATSMTGISSLDQLTAEQKESLRRYLIYGFFGPDIRNKTLLDLLKKAPAAVPKLLIYGGRDSKVGQQYNAEIARQSRLLNLAQVIVPNAAHEDLSRYDLAEQKIYSFLRDPARLGGFVPGKHSCTATLTGYAPTCSGQAASASQQGASDG